MARVVIINAGMSEDSATARLGRAIESALNQAARSRNLDPVDVRWVNLRALARPIADHLVTGFPSGDLASALALLREADGLVALTPVYQGSYSGLFKSFVDLVDDGALEGVPVLLGATGGSPRHALVTEHALRPLFSHLRTLVVPTAVFVATEDWGAHADDSDGVGGSRLRERIARAADQLLAYASPTAVGRVVTAPLRSHDEPMSVPGDVEALLASLSPR